MTPGTARKWLTSSWLRSGIAVIIGFLSLWLALRNVSFEAVGAALRNADRLFILLTLLSIAVNILAKSLRWQVIIGKAGHGIGLGQLLASLLAGQAINTLYPARLGDLSRAYAIGRMGPGKTFILGTVLLEKTVDTLAYSVLFLTLLLLIPLPEWVNRSMYGFAAAAVVGSILILLVAYRLDSFMGVLARLVGWLPPQWRGPIETRLNAGISSLKILQSRWDLLKIILLTLLIWGTAILNNHLVLLALQIHLPLTASLLLLVVLQASVSLPQVIPAGIGLYEYLCILALGVFGVAESPAFSYGVLLHLLVAGPTTLLGLIYLFKLGLAGSNRQRMLKELKNTGPASRSNPPQ